MDKSCPHIINVLLYVIYGIADVACGGSLCRELREFDRLLTRKKWYTVEVTDPTSYHRDHTHTVLP